MNMDQLTLFGIIPAILVVLAGMLVRRASGRHFLLFWLAVNDALLSAQLVAGREGGSAFTVTSFLAPATLGVIVLILIHFKEFMALRRNEKVVALALSLTNVILLAYVGRQGFGQTLIFFGLSGAVWLAVVWNLGRSSRPMAALLVVAALAMLGLCNAITAGALAMPAQPPLIPTWLSLPAQLLVFSLPGLVAASAAVLLATALKPHPSSEKMSAGSWWPAVWRLLLAVVLLGYLTYTIVWASIWDRTDDGMTGLFLAMPNSLTAIAAGMAIGATSFGWRRLAGLAFAVVVPLMLFGAFNYGWSISNHALTESRAAHIQAAVEHFHSRTGSYPAELSQLVPGELWWISGPVILAGQGWCYQGGKDFYRLGVVFRETWGFPLSIRIYASAGNLPQTSWECDTRLADLKPRYDPQPSAEPP